MFCRRCGEQTASDTRFCSRCGLSLDRVEEGAGPDGLPARQEAEPVGGILPDRGGSQIGAKLMFLSGVLVPICLSLGLFKRSLQPLIGSFWFDGPAILLIPAIVFFAGLVWMLYTRLFEQNGPAGQPIAKVAIKRDALPSAPSPGLDTTQGGFQSRLNTAEIVERPSVTDHTTRLLG